MGGVEKAVTYAGHSNTNKAWGFANRTEKIRSAAQNSDQNVRNVN